MGYFLNVIGYFNLEGVYRLPGHFLSLFWTIFELLDPQILSSMFRELPNRLWCPNSWEFVPCFPNYGHRCSYLALDSSDSGESFYKDSGAERVRRFAQSSQLYSIIFISSFRKSRVSAVWSAQIWIYVGYRKESKPPMTSSI